MLTKKLKYLQKEYVNLTYENLIYVNLNYVNLKYWCIQLSVAKTAEVFKLDLNIDVGPKTVRLVFFQSSHISREPVNLG